MTQHNTPESQPDSNKIDTKKSKSQRGASELLKGAIYREFGNPINPILFNQYRKNKGSIQDVIVGHMKDIREGDLEEWAGIEVKDIMDINAQEIHQKILNVALPLISLRRKAFQKILEVYSDTGVISDRLQGEIDLLGQDELRELSTKKSAIRNFMKRNFSEVENIHPRDMLDFEVIFHDINELGLSTHEVGKIQKMFSRYKQFGSSPDSYDLRDILFAYKLKPTQRKLEILSSLQAKFDLRFAKNNGLIDENYLEKFAQENFGELFTSLPSPAQEAFLNYLRNNSELYISSSDILASGVDALFLDKNKLKDIGQNIIQGMGLSNRTEINNKDSVLAKIKEKNPDIDDYHLHEAFLEYTKNTLRTPDRSECLVQGIEKFYSGSVVEFGEEGNIQYFRLKETRDSNGQPLDVYNGITTGVRVQGLPVENGRIVGSDSRELSYDDLYKFFLNSKGTVRVLSGVEFKERITQKSSDAGIDGKLFDATGLDTEPPTRENIAAKLDGHDSEGQKHGFEAGTYFKAPEAEKNGKSETKIWKVEKVEGTTVHIRDQLGFLEQNIPLEQVYELAKGGKFKRISRVEDDQSFLHQLGENFGLSDHASLEGGSIVEKHKNPEGKEEKHTVRCFENKESHIRISEISEGMVHFGEYQKGDIHTGQKLVEEQGVGKAKKALYNEKQLTLGAFLDYLKEKKLTVGGEDILDPHAHSSHDGEHGHDPHIHGSFFSRLGKMQNFASMWKGFEMIWHSLEHTLEKGSKLDAAKFALKTSKLLHLPDGIEAQLYADIVDGSKEIVEKYKNKIANLPGPAGRYKCIHIAHNTDARPEEVMAAIQFMVSGYGHLYAEDIKHYQSIVTPENLRNKKQGYFAFFDNFVHTARLPGGIVYWREKAYDKIINEMGDKKKHEGEPTEEMLLHALFKSIDGNPEEFPYAASVVKSIGGPGGFEKDWKFDGYDNAYEKGKKQTTMVNAQGRLNKAIGYLSTHELYKAIGGMEQVAAKGKEPELQAFPFVWATLGYTQYASPKAIQALKGYAENGLSFHAYSFLRRQEDNSTYRDTVKLALQQLINQNKIDSNALNEFNAICKRLENGPEDADITKTKYNKVSAPEAMTKFWQDHYNSGLHDMLQNKNGWLTVAAKSNTTAKKYRDLFVGAHNMQLKDPKIPGGSEFGPDWYNEHGYQNIIMGTDKEGLRTLEPMLNKIKFTTTNRGGKPMEKETEAKIWDYVVDYMKSPLRDTEMFLGKKDIQKSQFLAHREEIILYFSGQLSASEVKDPADIERIISDRSYKYFSDLIEMGIDPRALFDQKLLKKNAEADYERWKNGGGMGKGTQVMDVIEEVKKTAYHNARNDGNFQNTMNRIVQNTPEKPVWKDTDNDPETRGHSEGIPITAEDD